MAEYKGGGAEAARAAMLEKQRTKMIEDFQKQKDQIQKVDTDFPISNVHPHSLPHWSLTLQSFYSNFRQPKFLP